MEIIIDAAGSPMGRIASFAAKEALKGNKIVILNCNESVVTGNQKAILDVYLEKRKRGGFSQKGPYLSNHPERIMRRAVRGMVPWEKSIGRTAYKLVECYTDEGEFASKTKKTFDKAKPPYLTLKKISELI